MDKNHIKGRQELVGRNGNTKESIVNMLKFFYKF